MSTFKKGIKDKRVLCDISRQTKHLAGVVISTDLTKISASHKLFLETSPPATWRIRFQQTVSIPATEARMSSLMSHMSCCLVAGYIFKYLSMTRWLRCAWQRSCCWRSPTRPGSLYFIYTLQVTLYALCIMFYILCIMFYALCLMLYASCIVLYALCRRSPTPPVG